MHDPTNPDELGDGSDVALEDVSVWRDGESVLAHVDASWLAGDVVAVSGPSGSGKTTLAHLVARFLEPHAGHATLGGIDLQHLDGAQVRTRVGYVDDDPHVFATTLAANVRLARPTATDEEILEALLAAGLGPLLLTLPLGIKTQLGGAVVGLSGGERRRLGVARALLAKRPVMVLDEPTEGLDDAEARALLDEVRRHQITGIAIIISHQGHDHDGATIRLAVNGGRVLSTN